MNEMRTIELDLALNEGEAIDVVLAELTNGIDVGAEIVTMNGPAGGHPLIRYTGTKAGLLELARRYDQPFGDTYEMVSATLV